MCGSCERMSHPGLGAGSVEPHAAACPTIRAGVYGLAITRMHDVADVDA